MASCFDGANIDWNAPWFLPWRAHGKAVLAHQNRGLSLPDALNALEQAPLDFCAQDRLPEGSAYEQYIAQTGQVPTRSNAHDFFNALCWMHWPESKLQLNRLQSEVIEAQGIGDARGAVRDACTVFDENAALIQIPDDLWDDLRHRRWQHALWTQRERWAKEVRVWMFGHAALEKLIKPYKSITVHLWRVPQGLQTLQDLDAWLAMDLQADKLAQKPFSPLPILGVPGWHAANAQAGFYDDPCVFRPFPRDASPQSTQTESAPALAASDFPSSSGGIPKTT
jgi:Protein of unknown function (DUF3025)